MPLKEITYDLGHVMIWLLIGHIDAIASKFYNLKSELYH